MLQAAIPDKVTNLVIVPGHAIYLGQSAAEVYNGNNWLGTYNGYRYNDEVPNYVLHVQRGVNLVDQDNRALLVFSGGKTRKWEKQDKTPIPGVPFSEARSYLNIAEQLAWFGAKAVRNLTRLEEFATDSFENLVFSIKLFQSLHPQHRIPQQVTVVGLRFKKERYQFHADTIIDMRYQRIDPFVFRYDDINDIPEYVFKAGSGQGEELTRLQFRECPLGDQGPLLEKRLSRDPYDWYKKKPY